MCFGLTGKICNIKLHTGKKRSNQWPFFLSDKKMEKEHMNPEVDKKKW